MWNSLPDYVVMSDKHKHNLLILSKTVLMHIGNTEIFYFIIVQPDLMPDFSINSGIEPLHRLHFNDSEILDKLNKLNVNKTPGPDNQSINQSGEFL